METTMKGLATQGFGLGGPSINGKEMDSSGPYYSGWFKRGGAWQSASFLVASMHCGRLHPNQLCLRALDSFSCILRSWEATLQKGHAQCAVAVASSVWRKMECVLACLAFHQAAPSAPSALLRGGAGLWRCSRTSRLRTWICSAAIQSSWHAGKTLITNQDGEDVKLLKLVSSPLKKIQIRGPAMAAGIADL